MKASSDSSLVTAIFDDLKKNNHAFAVHGCVRDLKKNVNTDETLQVPKTGLQVMQESIVPEIRLKK